MVKAKVVVRDLDRSKPFHELDFELPEIPAIGSYLSIRRPDAAPPFGEDFVVHAVWWRLSHPAAGAEGGGAAEGGKLQEILIECGPATSPYSSDEWLRWADGARARGLCVPAIGAGRRAIRDGEPEPDATIPLEELNASNDE
ncbi:hypothetical protein K9U39_07890 [Rhodoblastus acidophilus]|uniref:Uncharacterized protein n=1 Tax=Candidatus Rhodoblastus alkanivorans TaxID=2954117 RepID=A0ABS9Z924_9HYPH|nr:hypothetical protein [Candidatus Rhodoblastus alkanivorans]MCI4678293.1 hypothetical protein [Candidatus Rhodoblastus alkanivorans]MCI4683551.1 hypothetical protein [Candidatus Rhodoblastus alkanivorans]MDI4640866.1 hypothetical protein [Rhodoblastus acidophilus]